MLSENPGGADLFLLHCLSWFPRAAGPVIQVFAVINQRLSINFPWLVDARSTCASSNWFKSACNSERGTFYVVSVKTLKLLRSSRFMDGKGARLMSSPWKLLVSGENRTGSFVVINSVGKTDSHSCLPLPLRCEIAIPLTADSLLC